MNDEDLEGLLETLELSLQNLGLGAIVEQERTSAIDGKVIETTRDDTKGRRRSKDAVQPEVGDVRRVPLTPRDRLAILLDLLEVAVGGTFAIEERVLSFNAEEFEGSGESEPKVWFRVDRGEEFVVRDERDWSLPGRLALESRRESVREVLATVAKLRAVAEIAPNRALAIAPEERTGASNRILGWA